MSVPSDQAMPGAALQAQLDRLQVRSLWVGVIGLALCVAGALIWPHRFFAAYLVGFLFWIGIALGSLGITMLHHLVGGSWGLPVRRPMEAGAMTLLPLAVLFLPVAFNLPILYPWARPEEVRLDEDLYRKTAYLNVSFFLIRALAYFAIWIVFAFLLRRWSRAQDETTDPAPSHRLQQMSGPGLVLLFLTGTFAAMDWGMSLEPNWASTIYGTMLIVGQALSTLALMIAVAIMLTVDRPMNEVATPARLHDLGNLLLAFVMLWAYMAFSQFLIIWAGDLSEEIPWYLRRTHGGWQWIALLLDFVPLLPPVLRPSLSRE